MNGSNTSDPATIIARGQALVNPNNPSSVTANSGANIAAAGKALADSNQVSQPTQPSNVKQPGLLERLLPTIGGIGGGLLGGALDLGTGGLAFALDPALAGLGSAAGKSLENALMGQNPLQANDITSGLEGAAGQLGGMGVSKLLGAGGEALTNYGAGQAATAADQASSQVAADEAARIGNEFGAIKPGQASVGQAIGKLNDLGIAQPTAEDMTNVGRVYTGSNPETGTGVLNFVKNNALEQAGGKVDLNNSMDSLHNTLAQPENQILGGENPVSTSRGQLPKLPDNAATRISGTFRNMLPEGTLDENGLISDQLSPQDGQKLLKSVGEQITATTPKANALGIIDPADQAENNVWRSIYQNVRQSVYNRPEVDAAVANTTVDPNLEAAIDDAIKTNGITDPQVAANIKSDLINTINNSQNADQLLTAERPMVNVAKVGDIQSADEMNNPQLPRNVRAVKSQIKTQAPANNLMNNPLKLAADAAGAYGIVKGKPQDALPAILMGLGGSPGALQAVGGGLSAAGGATGQGILGALGEVVGNSPNDVPNPNSGNGQISNQGADMNGNNLVDVALREALMTPMLGGLNQLGTLTPLAQKLNAAQGAEQGLAQSFNNAGGAQGPIGGLLARLGSTFTGAPAGNYGAQAQQAQQVIGNALGEPAGAIATPQITQNKATAQQALNNIQNLITTLMVPTNTSGSLMSAIGG